MGNRNIGIFENGEVTEYAINIYDEEKDENEQINDLIVWYNNFYNKAPNPRPLLPVRQKILNHTNSIFPDWLMEDIRSCMKK